MLRPSRITSEIQQALSPFEIIANGNVAGDNDNWREIIIGDNLVRQVKISGNWETAETSERPA